MADIVKREERLSKDKRFKFTIDYYKDGTYEVYCLKDGGNGEFSEVHWHRTYRDEAIARAEYLRFD